MQRELAMDKEQHRIMQSKKTSDQDSGGATVWAFLKDQIRTLKGDSHSGDLNFEQSQITRITNDKKQVKYYASMLIL